VRLLSAGGGLPRTEATRHSGTGRWSEKRQTSTTRLAVAVDIGVDPCIIQLGVVPKGLVPLLAGYVGGTLANVAVRALKRSGSSCELLD
jgi:hypothetical protein